MPTTRHRPARAKILNAAAELFYEQGITATGIDTVIDHAGVARKSLYNNFASKDDLVAAYIEARHQQWLGLHEHRLREVEHPTTDDLVLAVVDAYIDHATADGDRFRGCGLLNTAAEFPPDSLARQTVRHHKEEVEQFLIDALCMNAPRQKAEEAQSLATQLSFILEGAVTRAGLEGSIDRLLQARTMIAELTAAAA
jgi:AcrR family transcriptional regulator